MHTHIKWNSKGASWGHGQWQKGTNRPNAHWPHWDNLKHNGPGWMWQQHASPWIFNLSCFSGMRTTLRLKALIHWFQVHGMSISAIGKTFASLSSSNALHYSFPI